MFIFDHHNKIQNADKSIFIKPYTYWMHNAMDDLEKSSHENVSQYIYTLVDYAVKIQ